MRPADDRGQAVQVGAVLLLAIVVVALSLYQATVVPNQNERIEYADYRDATGDVADLRDAVLRAATDGDQVGVTMRTGTQYPNRVLFVNPPTAAGTMRTTDAGTVRLSGVVATDSEGRNVRAFWDGTERTFESRNVVFDPDYNVFEATPVRITQGYTYRAYSPPVSVTPQTLVQGNRISLISTVGEVGTSGYRTSLTTDPVSPQSRTVSITGEGGDPFSITVVSDLPPSVWEDRVLADQVDPPGGPDEPDDYVRGVADGPTDDTVTVTFEGDENYRLRLGRVELRGTNDDATVPPPDAQYITHEGDTVVEDGREGRAKLVVETRDGFNNPRSNVPVTFNVTSGTLEDAEGNVLGTDAVTVESEGDGEAVVWYNASAGVFPVEAYLGESVDRSLPAHERINFSVVSTAQGEESTFILLDDTNISGRGQGNMVVTLNNTGEGSINLTGIQLGHVTNMQGNPSDGPDEIVRFSLGGETRTVNAEENLRAKFFRNNPVSLAAGTNTMEIEFDASYDSQVMIRFHLYFEGGVSAVFDLVIFR